MELLELPNLDFYNVWGLWSSKSSFFLDPKKRKKQFKINCLGVFLGTHLAALWARRRFFDRPLVAHHGPSAGLRNSHFSNIILTFCALGFPLWTLPAHPSFQKHKKCIGFTMFLKPSLSPCWATSGGSKKRVLAHDHPKGLPRKTLKPFILRCF